MNPLMFVSLHRRNAWLSLLIVKTKVMLKEIKIEKFTAFEELDVKLSKGINVLIGANGTGKTHLMKFLYGAMQLADSRAEKSMDQIIQGLF